PERDPFNYLVQKHGLSKKDLSIASTLKQLKESCIENYTNCWKNQMKESSKLNVYRTLKKDCKLAPYLIQIKNYKRRITNKVQAQRPYSCRRKGATQTMLGGSRRETMRPQQH